MTVNLSIERFWHGAPLPAAACAVLQLQLLTSGDLRVDFDAPFHNDPPPPSAPGITPQLWNFEVIELFISGQHEHYLELEFGPHGHHLGLTHEGVRKPTAIGIPVDYTVVSRSPIRFAGQAVVSSRFLPRAPHRANAYAIHAHGCGGQTGRCYHAHAPVPGEHADFHQPRHFVPIRLAP